LAAAEPGGRWPCRSALCATTCWRRAMLAAVAHGVRSYMRS